MAPERPAVRVPPCAAACKRAHAVTHAELKNTGEKTRAWQTDDKALQNPEPRARLASILGGVVAVAGVLAMTGLWIKDSIAYHPTYVERLRAMEARLLDPDNQGASDGGEH